MQTKTLNKETITVEEIEEMNLDNEEYMYDHTTLLWNVYHTSKNKSIKAAAKKKYNSMAAIVNKDYTKLRLIK